MNRYKVLTLPVETKNRELLGKLLLAAKAAEKSWVVFIGHHGVMRTCSHMFKPGVMFEMNIPEHKCLKSLRPFTGAGHLVANICEESIVYPDGKDYCQRKVGENALRMLWRFYATGRRHARDISENRQTSPGQLVIAGNHRFDILRPVIRSIYDADVDTIRKKYGNYILINTNFGRCNPHPGYGDRLKALQKNKVISTLEQERLWLGLKEYKADIMQHFLGFLPRLSEKYSGNIVIRPHPSENHDAWRQWTSAYINVHIVHEGNVNPWLIGAQAVIHNGCTTGIEGFVLGRPVIAYVPDRDNPFAKGIANDVSYVVSNAEELLIAVDKAVKVGILDEEEQHKQKVEQLKYYIENIDGPLSCDTITDDLDKHDVAEYDLDDILFCYRKKSEAKNLNIISIARKVVRKGLSMFRVRPDYTPVLRQKFPGLCHNDILEPLKIWKDAGIIQRMPMIRKMQKDLFCMYCQVD